MIWNDADNPFRTEGLWLKGALHAHTTESDGSLSPDEVVRAYREDGFDFLVLTDHDKVTTCDGSDGDFLTLGGIELGVNTTEPNKYWHFVGVGAEDVPPVEVASPVELYEHLRSRVPFCALAHPYWSQLSGSDLTLFDGLASVEVFNSGCEMEVGRGRAEYQWDWCLSTGRRVTGLAVDDCHGPREIGLGWVMVKSQERSSSAILSALSGGMFYSSAGPEIRDVRLSEEGVEVATSPCRSIRFIGDRQSGAHIRAEDAGDITSACYVPTRRESYVRVECVDARGRKVWSNPFYPTWPIGPADEGSP